MILQSIVIAVVAALALTFGGGGAGVDTEGLEELAKYMNSFVPFVRPAATGPRSTPAVWVGRLRRSDERSGCFKEFGEFGAHRPTKNRGPKTRSRSGSATKKGLVRGGRK